MNHEYGLLVTDADLARQIEGDVGEYAALGADVDRMTLDRMCELATDARAAYQAQLASASRQATRRLRSILRTTSDTLIRARLAKGPIHTIFANTIEYLLRRNGPMRTEALHVMIQRMHSDLCDDRVDRVIDGKSYGKKWKHAVRTAQQQLKKRGVIAFNGDVWGLVR